MKHTIIYTGSVLLFLLAFATSCLGDMDMEVSEKGWLNIASLEKTATEDVRATVDDEGEIDYWVSINRSGVSVMSPTLFSSISGRIALSAGDGYTLSAESCSKTEAEISPTVYGQPRYAGSTPFAIVANESTNVHVQCSMANAAFKVEKGEGFYYTEYSVTATSGYRTLIFTDEQQVGYFNVGDNGTTELQYEVVAKDVEGHIGRGSGTITLKSRNLSKLMLKATPMGYVNVGVVYDDTFTPVVTEIVVTE